MNGEKKPNIIIRRERQLRGWSQQKVAELVGTSEDVVSRWERGERKPSPFFQEKLCMLYGRSTEELGFIPPSLNMFTATTTQMEDIHVIDERLDQAESIINLSWEAWFASRPKQVVREVTKLLFNLEKTILTPLAAVHKLHAKELIMRGHGLLGGIYLDELQKDAAFYHYSQAHKVAEEIHDINLSPTYFVLIGDVLRRQNDKMVALSYMEQARDQAIRTANMATLGYVLQILAYAYSDIGNEAAFECAISKATDLLAFADEGKDAAKKEFTPFEIYEIQGKANRDLGKPLKAISYLELAEKSLNHTDSMMPRWRALLEISRGQALYDAGEIKSAIDVISKGFILAYQCHSPHQMNRVRKLLKKLESGPDKSFSEVQNLKSLLYETYMRMDNNVI
ncbi:helix-turn-helix domain-containing protein [Ktedonosporobacter rubrisoli]|uniref:Helix-turn-helix domain-containing protein n=1 Tax=Ktedonosporobacter rubrisoli TaxID=2509675 RepID=A0A4P6JJB9_KTERU|nr:helix-turn-helix domain-containing protein [Ktedonosporobacter rubrisoli]QBD75012.1 helix-turn-helix domain-containing protein [Ktedonosporobacter rubrisoli]